MALITITWPTTYAYYGPACGGDGRDTCSLTYNPHPATALHVAVTALIPIVWLPATALHVAVTALIPVA